MKLLFVAENLTYGGAPRRFIDLANAMADRGMDTTLFVFNGSIQLRDKLNSAVKCIERQGIKKSNGWFSRNVIYRKKCIQYINNFLEENKYDTIISFNDMVNISILLSKKARTSTVVISERSDPNYNKMYLQFIKKILFKRANGLVFQTKGAQDFFGEKIKRKSIVIPNPIPSNVNFKRYVGEREKIIVSVARLWLYQKRQDVLIEAFKKLIQTHPDYKLILYGDGPDKDKIREIIVHEELESNIFLAGVTNNVFDSIKKASLFVLSSDFEGIPNSLIEAMSIGLPVISTDCSPGGARFLIKHGVNGMLVPRGNSLKLSEAMEYIIDNPDIAKKMGERAVNVVKLLDEKKIYDSWEKYLLTISRY